MDFQNIEDTVDIENQQASVRFEMHGDAYAWDLTVDNDWVDPQLFSKIVQLSEKYKTEGKLTIYDTGGQSVVFGWTTPTQLEKVRRIIGLDIKFYE